MLDKAGIVVAHYHPQGLVRDDLLALIEQLSVSAHRLIFVSTQLNDAGAARLSRFATVIVRDNHGYDFYSYKIGIDALGELSGFGRLVIFNSSFICADRDKLVRGFFAASHPRFDAYGLTYSREHRRHLQSFLLSFGPGCLRSDAFASWWAQMQPIDDRNLVIARYELGLSSFLRRSRFTVGRAYHPTWSECMTALSRARRGPQRTLNPWKLNPTHFYWDFILRDFGVAKIEMVGRDPYNLLDARTRERLTMACGAAGAA